MEITLQEKINELVDELHPAIGVKKPIQWGKYKVYVPIYKSPMCIGLPLVILVDGDNARISTPEESIDFLNYQCDLSLKKNLKKNRKKRNV